MMISSHNLTDKIVEGSKNDLHLLQLIGLILGYFLSSQTLLEFKYFVDNNHRINNQITRN